MKFRDKVVVVTGGGSGIGEQLALRLFQQGATVVLAGRRAEKLAAVAALAPNRERVLAVPIDVGEYADLVRLIEVTIEKHERIDVLVNNAGVNYGGDLGYMTPEEIAYALRVNLNAPIWLTQLALPHLRKLPEAMIVNVMSLSAMVPIPFQSVYAASKAGLSGFTRVMQRELRNSSVHILAAYPGGVDTGMMTEEIKQKFKELGSHQPALMPAAEAARQLLDAMVERRKSVIIAEPKDRVTLLLNNWLPFLIERALDQVEPKLREIMMLGNEMQRSRKTLTPIHTPSGCAP